MHSNEEPNGQGRSYANSLNLAETGHNIKRKRVEAHTLSNPVLYSICKTKIQQKYSRPIEDRDFLSDNQKLHAFLKPYFKDVMETKERMLAIYFNSGSQILQIVHLADGGRSFVNVDVMLYCYYAINCLASASLLIHNHPSGTLLPSKADIETTEKIINAGSIIGCHLIDHLIITSSGINSVIFERE